MQRPQFEHERGINDYDYSLDSIDEVDALAREHDIAYDYDGYGEGSGVLPSYMTDTNTILADVEFVQGLQDYLDRSSSRGFKDRYTGRKSSRQARKAASNAISFFKIVIAYKINQLIKQSQENDDDD